MTYKKIKKWAKNKDKLTTKQKRKLAKAMLNNKKATEQMLRGALISGNWQLAIMIANKFNV